MKYRKDGYCWKKRKDGKTTREDHMKLKVQGVEVKGKTGSPVVPPLPPCHFWAATENLESLASDLMPVTTVKRNFVCQVLAVGIDFCSLTPEFLFPFLWNQRWPKSTEGITGVCVWGLARCLQVLLLRLPGMRFWVHWGAGVRKGRCRYDKASLQGASGSWSFPSGLSNSFRG